MRSPGQVIRKNDQRLSTYQWRFSFECAPMLCRVEPLLLLQVRQAFIKTQGINKYNKCTDKSRSCWGGTCGVCLVLKKRNKEGEDRKDWIRKAVNRGKLCMVFSIGTLTIKGNLDQCETIEGKLSRRKQLVRTILGNFGIYPIFSSTACKKERDQATTTKYIRPK